MKLISKLQYISTSADLAEQACNGGIDWIQLRLKNVSYDEYFSIGKEVQAVCKQYKAMFIVNDSTKLALALDADGVHLGKNDPKPQEDLDELVRRNSIIGWTVNTLEDIFDLAGKPVSYMGLGPFRFTTTKQKLSPILGLEGYRNIFTALRDKGVSPPPIVGIGGITENDVPDLLAAGLYGIAVSGAISGARDVVAASAQLKRTVYYQLQDHVI